MPAGGLNGATGMAQPLMCVRPLLCELPRAPCLGYIFGLQWRRKHGMVWCVWRRSPLTVAMPRCVVHFGGSLVPQAKCGHFIVLMYLPAANCPVAARSLYPRITGWSILGACWRRRRGVVTFVFLYLEHVRALGCLAHVRGAFFAPRWRPRRGVVTFVFSYFCIWRM